MERARCCETSLVQMHFTCIIRRLPYYFLSCAMFAFTVVLWSVWMISEFVERGKLVSRAIFSFSALDCTYKDVTWSIKTSCFCRLSLQCIRSTFTYQTLGVMCALFLVRLPRLFFCFLAVLLRRLIFPSYSPSFPNDSFMEHYSSRVTVTRF